MTTNRIVIVEWIDSVEYEDANWKDQEEADSLKPMKIRSAGILIKDKKEYVTLASSINENDPDDLTYGGLLAIPTAVITKRYDFPKSFTNEIMSDRMKEIEEGTWPGPGV